ncbi:hypothetical protein [Luteimonas salinilitoris]|uniref:Secreted protein n=1 Tax=Luteimonas salinilitoris TaxID=3237697 RepID=A0ABV4HNN3_9GAMM
MLAIPVFLLMAISAHAAGPGPGEYGTRRGWGSLVIRDAPDGRRRFEMSTVGANGHMCDLEGAVDGSSAVTADELGEACRMTFTVDGPGIAVKAETEACRRYCGMRAGFEGEYVRLPAGCTPAARERAQADFLSQYRSGRYAAALGRLNVLGAECGDFFDWLQRDRFANDRAVTLWHLGRLDECIAVLDSTLAAGSYDEASLVAALREQGMALPPGDWDAYLPIARAAWFNRSKCGAMPG